MTSPVTQLSDALTTLEPLVGAVTSDQWPAPTPCSDWSVRDLVNHLVVGNLLFAGVVAGRGTIAELRPALAGDQLGTQPAQTWRDAALVVVQAFSVPGVLDRPVTIPFGSVSGMVALHLRITEVLTHGWDLARATGRPVRFEESVVTQELEFSESLLAQVPSERKVFGPRQNAAPEAASLDRLAALLGRDPTWTA